MSNKPKKWLRRYIILMSLFGGINNGYNTALTNGLIGRLQILLQLTGTQEGIVTSSLFFGAILGCFIAGFYLNDKLGRRPTTIVGESVIILGTIGHITFLNFYTIFVTRFIVGIGLGICSVTKPLYVAELSSADSRGYSLAVFSVAFSLGVMLVTIFENILPNPKDIDGNFLNRDAWRIEVGLGSIPAFALLVISSYVLPESPIWIELQKVRHIEEKTYQIDPIVSHNEDITNRDIETETLLSSNINIDKTKISSEEKNAAWFAFMIAIILSIGHQFSLISIVMGLTTEFIERLGVPSRNSLYYLFAIDGTHLIGVLCSLPLIDKYGRRILVLIGCSITFTSMLVIVLFEGLSPHVNQTSSLYYAWISKLIAICLFVFGFQIGISSTYYVIISEIFPIFTRGVGNGVGSALLFIWQATIMFGYSATKNSVSIIQLLSFSALSQLITLVMVYMFLPESKGVKLDEVTKLWTKFLRKKKDSL